MSYTSAAATFLLILLVAAFGLWGVPLLTRERPPPTSTLSCGSGGSCGAPRVAGRADAAAPSAKDQEGAADHSDAPRDSLEWLDYHASLQAPPTKENYGEPPGLLRAVHRDELGPRGWPDMPPEYEGSSASALSAFMERSA